MDPYEQSIEETIEQMVAGLDLGPDLGPGFRQMLHRLTNQTVRHATEAVRKDMRFVAARAAMQGLLAGTDWRPINPTSPVQVATAAKAAAGVAVAFGDALLAALNTPPTTESKE